MPRRADAGSRTTRLADQIAYNHATSPLPAPSSDAAGVRAGDPRTSRPRAPAVHGEAEIAGSQADGALLGVNQCAPTRRRSSGSRRTGGTTGQPMRIGLTRRDIADYGEMGARALWAMGCRPSDIVFSA